MSFFHLSTFLLVRFNVDLCWPWTPVSTLTFADLEVYFLLWPLVTLSFYFNFWPLLVFILWSMFLLKLCCFISIWLPFYFQLSGNFFLYIIKGSYLLYVFSWSRKRSKISIFWPFDFIFDQLISGLYICLYI